MYKKRYHLSKNLGGAVYLVQKRFLAFYGLFSPAFCANFTRIYIQFSTNQGSVLRIQHNFLKIMSSNFEAPHFLFSKYYIPIEGQEFFMCVIFQLVFFGGPGWSFWNHFHSPIQHFYTVFQECGIDFCIFYYWNCCDQTVVEWLYNIDGVKFECLN